MNPLRLPQIQILIAASILMSSVALIVWNPSTVSAQLDTLSSLATAASISLEPEYPRPGDTVRARIVTTSVDLGTSMITWYLNGEKVQESEGVLVYTFTAGKVGDLIALKAQIRPKNQQIMTLERVNRVSDIILVWESTGYVPPLYKGRALLAPGGEVVVNALPVVFSSDGTPIDPSTLVYTWRIDRTVQPYARGTGKNSITVKNENLFRPIRVSVTVEKGGAENILTGGYIDVVPTQSEILFYEDSKLQGVQYDRALVGSYSLTASEATIVAEPYYLSTRTRTDPSLTYAWQIGGASQSNPGTIVLRPEGSGKAQLSLTVSNTEYLAQRIRGDLSVLFTANGAARDSSPQTTPL